MIESAPAAVQLHAGQLEALPDDRLAVGLDDAGSRRTRQTAPPVPRLGEHRHREIEPGAGKHPPM